MTLMDTPPLTDGASEFTRDLREQLLARVSELRDLIAERRREIKQYVDARENEIAVFEDELDRVREGARALDPDPPRRGRPPKSPTE